MGPRNSVAERRGFTLTELLMVIGIMVLVTAIATPVLIGLNRGRRIRDTAQVLQATLARARDLAVSSGKPVGVRFIPDDSAVDASFVRNLQIVTVPDADQAGDGQGFVGTCHVVRPSGVLSAPSGTLRVGDPDPAGTPLANYSDQPDTTNPANLLVVGSGGQFPVLTGGGLFSGSIRIGDAGPIYAFTQLIAGNRNVLALRGIVPPQAVYNPRASSAAFVTDLLTLEGVPYRILRSGTVENVPYPGEDPITLPGQAQSGVVIDLNATASSVTNRLSKIDSVTYSAGGTPIWEVMFTPSGQVLPPNAGLAYVAIWLREEALTNPDSQLDTTGGANTRVFSLGASTPTRRITGDGVIPPPSPTSAIVVVNTRTGYVSTVSPVFEDNDGNGIYDFARYYDNVMVGNQRGF